MKNLTETAKDLELAQKINEKMINEIEAKLCGFYKVQNLHDAEDSKLNEADKVGVYFLERMQTQLEKANSIVRSSRVELTK